MKKKTKSKLKNSFPLAFFLAILFCLFGAGINGHFFIESFFATFTKFNEKPIATITFKHKTAQRRFIDSFVWDRLKQKSDLYNGDTVHTSNFSEALITCNDGNTLDIYENTMIQIFRNEEDKSGLELFEGSAGVETTEDSDFILKVGEKNVNLDSTSKANFSKNQNDLSVQVLSGSASVSDENGTYRNISQGEEALLNGNEVEIARPKLRILSPTPNQRFLYHTEELFETNFEWQIENIAESSKTTLEISKDKKFSNIELTQDISSVSSIILPLKSGIHYWKIKYEDSENDTIELTGKIQIIQSLKTNLVAPVQDYSYFYRTRKPAIRFIWTESEMASSYRIVISKNRDLSSPIIEQRLVSNSTIISTLEAGTYYWKIMPFYQVNKVGYAEEAESEIQSFQIENKGNLYAPKLYIPKEDSIVNIEENAKSTSFSWRIENEAVKYKVEFFKGNESNPQKTLTTSDNYIILNGNKDFSEGKWYWQVKQIDSEGNESSPSTRFSFFAMKGQPEQKTIEPPNNYKIAETLMQDISFTWKKSLPEDVISFLEIATDEKFKNTLYSEKVEGFSKKGIKLPLGDYYWRLSSKSDKGFSLETMPKKFSVVDNLLPPVLLDPKTRAITREGTPYTFKWQDVEGADYYKFALHDMKTGKTIFEEICYEPKSSLYMYGNNFVDHEKYHWEVQAKSNAIPGISTRRSGDLSEGIFELVKLKPVEVTSPKQNLIIDGVEAVLHKILIAWKSVDEVEEAKIVVSKVEKNKKKNVIFSTKEKIAPTSVRIANPDLRNGGNYEVIVYAKTLDGIDISNTEPKRIGRFSVTNVVPLPPAENLTTYPENFGEEYLSNKKNPRKINLKWDPVNNATDYLLQVKDKNGKVILKTEIEKKTSYDISWINLVKAQKTNEEKKALYKGNFTWSVEAVRMFDSDNDGVTDSILQPGTENTSSFIVDIPQVQSASGKGALNPYGK